MYKWLFLLYALCTIIYPLNDVLLPNLYSGFISELPIAGLNMYTLKLILILWIVIQVSMFMMDRIDAWFMPKLQRHLRKEIVEKIMDTFKENYRELEIGDILSKIIKLPQIVGNLFEQTREFTLPITMIIIFTTVFLYRINWQLALIFGVNITVLILMSFKFQGKCTDKSVCREKAGNMVYDSISDLFSNILNIYTCDKISSELKGMKGIEDIYENDYRNTIICSSKFRSTFYFMNYVILFSIMGWSYKLYRTGTVSSQQLLSILMIILILLSKLNDMTIEIRNLISSLGALKTIQTYLNDLDIISSQLKTDDMKTENHTIEEHSNPFTVPLSENSSIKEDYALVVQGLTVKYPTAEKAIINNLNFKIKHGEHVGILGRNGSGKSTLVKTILKLLQYQGQIYYHGQNLQQITRKDLHKLITYVPQHQVLFNRTIYRNIVYGVDRRISKDDVDRLITSLNIKHILTSTKKSNAYENNDNNGKLHYLDTMVGKNGNSISGGQRQIIFLLRCYLRDTPIIIFDEVTSALDQENRNEIKKLLNMIIKGKTLLMITHNPQDLEYLDRKINLS